MSLTRKPTLKGGHQQLSTTTSFVSGAISGIVTSCLLHPLDTLSGRLKVLPSANLTETTSRLLRKEGVRALYGGMGATLLSSLPTDAVYFCTYEICKREGTYRTNLPTPVVHFGAGCAAEISCSLIYHPFEVVKARMQLGTNVPRYWVRSSVPEGNYKHAPHAIWTIGRLEGVSGLYAGYAANLLTGCLLSATQFMLYEQFKKYLCVNIATPRTRETMSAGVLAGAMAGWITNPFDVIGTRIMVQGKGGLLLLENKDSSSTTELRNYRACFLELFKSEGYRGMFRGAVPRVLWCAPFSGISFAVYEYSKSVLTNICVE
jgi:solute carrier family 25 (mitochondrial iron transporter), member 28/37